MLITIEEYQNIKIFPYFPNCLEIFVIKNVKNTVLQTCVISDLNVEEIFETFYEKELQKTNQKETRLKKVIKKEDDKLYVKWKGFGN